jgi:hypothetical protein
MTWVEWVKILPEYIRHVRLSLGPYGLTGSFIYQRQREPATDIDIDVRFVGVQKGKWVIEVTCVLENKSLVRHTYRDFQVTVRYLGHTDEITDGPERIQYQLEAPKTIDDRIDKAKRFFTGVDLLNGNGNQNYINPRQQFRHRYVTWIPSSASFVWVQCKFDFSVGWHRKQKTNSQRVFRVPDSVDNEQIRHNKGLQPTSEGA